MEALIGSATGAWLEGAQPPPLFLFENSYVMCALFAFEIKIKLPVPSRLFPPIRNCSK
jgi:hypothetical protein